MTALELILVRHGESTANVSREQAELSGADVIPVECRDPDVPLSDVGRAQAMATGRELARLVPGELIAAAWSSPYVRARETADLALLAAGVAGPLRLDERLRDRELGVLDTLTARGVQNRYPLEARRREWLGKFYYRPPGGESWADVALRLRSFLADLDRLDTDGSVCVFTHDAVITVFRYVCGQLDEAGALALAREQPVGNASISTLTRADGDAPWLVGRYNQQDHLVDEQARDLRTQHPGELDVHPR